MPKDKSTGDAGSVLDATDLDTVLSPATAPAASVAPDEHHGMGGAYQLVDGKRVLIERTAPVAETDEPKKGA